MGPPWRRNLLGNLVSDSRRDILDRVRRARGRGALQARQRAPLEQRIKSHPRNLIPTRTDQTVTENVDLLVTMLQACDATVDRVASVKEVPEAAHSFLRTHNLPARMTVSPDGDLDNIDWQQAPTLEVDRGLPDPHSTVTGVTGALAAVAETGTLMLASGDGRPTTMNFLPDNHVVVLHADQVVGPYEDGWDRLREGTGPDGLPRTVNFITGPSRTGDIEQKLQLGAHGPRRLHVILVEDGKG